MGNDPSRSVDDGGSVAPRMDSGPLGMADSGATSGSPSDARGLQAPEQERQPDEGFDGDAGAEPVAGTPQAPPANQPVVDWSSTPTDSAPDALPPVVRLWRPGDVGVISFLLGFPAGIGLAARNWFRLGRRRRAYVHLAAGAAALLVIVLLPNISVGFATAVNIGVAIYLYRQAKAIPGDPVLAGRVIERAGVISGFGTIVGSWLLLLAPAVVAVFALALAGVGTGGVPGGTVAYGAGGSGCEVTGVASTFRGDQPIHVVAEFSRQVRPGEVVRQMVSEASTGPQEPSDLPVSQAADCYFYDFSAGSLPPGSYTVEYDIGTERLARGQVTIMAPVPSSAS